MYNKFLPPPSLSPGTFSPQEPQVCVPFKDVPVWQETQFQPSSDLICIKKMKINEYGMRNFANNRDNICTWDIFIISKLHMFEFTPVEILSIMHPVYNYNMWEGTPVVHECSSSRGVKFKKKVTSRGVSIIWYKKFNLFLISFQIWFYYIIAI